MIIIVRRPMPPLVRIISYLLSGMLLALTAALILEGALLIPLYLTWLISINVFTMIFYWVDKLNAAWVGESAARAARMMRIPEPALLLLALVGGSLGALLGMYFPRHKTSKPSFKRQLWLIVLVQIVALYLLWDRLPWA